jgi:hypothetical protein
MNEVCCGGTMLTILLMEAEPVLPAAAQPGSARGSQERPVVLRPGVALPIIGYAGAYAATVAAVILALVAHAGRSRVGMAPPSRWSDLGDRLIAGEVTAVFAWGFYKLGSQRIILNDDAMRIITWCLTWTVGRSLGLRRISRVRANLPLLLGLATLIAVEAVVATFWL